MLKEVRDRMLAHLGEIYPAGVVPFTRAGRRLAEPEFRACDVGWLTNCNGSPNLFDRDGNYLSRGGENRFHLTRESGRRRRRKL